MEQIELKVCGLDCPHCAQKISDKVNAMPEVKNAELDFMKNKFTVEPASGADMETVKDLVKTVIHEVEPEVRISDFHKAGHSHGDEEEDEELHKSDVIAVLAALVLFIASIFVPVELVSDILAITAYVLAGWEVVFSAIRNILKGQAFDESFLMTVATIGAFALGDFREGAAVMIFYQVGEIFQILAVQKSKKSITKLMELKPEFAMLKTAGGFEKKAPEEIQTGDVILVRAGEKIPLDGVIATGTSTLDTSVLTGESLPVEVAEGAEVMSGSVNLNGSLEIRVTSSYTESAVAKILDMVQNSATKKAKTEKFITRFARVYTPIVVGAAVLLALVPPFLLGLGSFSQWLYRGLVFLVVSCPCALVISVPLGFFAGIGGASHRGILIKGAKNIESLAACKTVAFDKTGTLTYGRFEVTEVEPAAGASEEDLLQAAAVAESASNHPIARSIVKRYGREIPAPERADEKAGNGILAVLGGETILCGKREFLVTSGVSVPEEREPVTKTAVYTAKSGKYLGRILLSDVMKKTTASAVKALEGMGIGTVLLTGDKEAPAREIAKQAGIRSVYSGLLPGDKVGIVEQLLADTGKRNVIFTGDGINDAPVIARADVGVAMGGAGSDIAIEAADVVLMEDEPVRIPEAVKISRRTMSIVRQNIIFAIGVKVAVMVLSAFGLAGMWAAVFADVGVTVLAILNSLRALRVPDFTTVK